MPPPRQDTPPPLGVAGTLLRLGAIGAVLLVAAGAFAYTGGWLSPSRLTQDRVMVAFAGVNGPHPGFRPQPRQRRLRHRLVREQRPGRSVV